jgi:hypothetical protein
MDNDFKELLSAFNDHKVKYLIVGGYAVSYHSEPRFTKDLNVFIQSTPENAKAVFQALAEYETPLGEITLEDFVNPETIFQIGVAPQRIDILQKITGVDFEAAWNNRVRGPVGKGDPLEANYISPQDLIRNKLAVGRSRDIADAEELSDSLRATGRPSVIRKETDL